MRIRRGRRPHARSRSEAAKRPAPAGSAHPGTVVNIVLNYLAQLIVETSSRELPSRAGLADPARRYGDPRTSYAELACGSVRRAPGGLSFAFSSGTALVVRSTSCR